MIIKVIKKYKNNLIECLIDIEDIIYMEKANIIKQHSKLRLYNRKYKQYVHRLILKCTDKDIHVDHIDFNPLNNSKTNLRLLPALLNQKLQPRKKTINSTSTYKGVCLDSWAVSQNLKKKWIARIKVNRKGINLGRYLTEIEAAIAYNKAALYYFGPLADINKDVPV